MHRPDRARVVYEAVGPREQVVVAARTRVQRHEAFDEGGVEFQLVAHARGARDAGLEDDGGAAVGGDRLDDFEGRGG